MRKNRPEPTTVPRRIAVLDEDFLEDLRYWITTNRKTALRLLDLVDSIIRDPFHGIGKPEPLRYGLEGAWSRRLTEEHRIVYLVASDRIQFVQARFHY